MDNRESGLDQCAKTGPGRYIRQLEQRRSAATFQLQTGVKFFVPNYGRVLLGVAVFKNSFLPGTRRLDPDVGWR